MVRILGPRDPKDKTAIITCSFSKDWSQGLSPFFLGPVPLYDGHVALNLENAWQYAKVYKEHTDEWGEPTEAYWTWAKKGWANKRAHRYPKGRGAIPEYSLWNGRKMGYIEARKEIYIKCYSEAVKQTDAFKELLKRYKANGDQITLWDVDGYDYLKLGMTLEEVVNNPNRIMGHAVVLALMLEGKI